MDINIDIILADLKDDKVPRTQKNLDKLNDILKAYAGSGQRDFSIAQMGRVQSMTLTCLFPLLLHRLHGL